MIKAFLLSVLIIGALSEDCSNLNGEYGCQGDQKAYPDSWDERRWQTPPRNDEHWKESYQDMHDVVGYAQLKYSSDRRICTIKFIATVNPALGNYQILYKFGDREQESNSFTVTPSQTQNYKDGFPISCRVLVNGQEKAKLVLEDEYFLWDNPTVNQGSQYEGGQKGAIVELFGWPYNDIAEECDFLGTAGYMAVKVFPVGEHILTYDTVEDGELNPWWFIYQPVSYRLTSRGGTKKEFKNMINTCRQKGVRVYADAVINHMAGNGNDMYWDHRNHAGSCVHWGAKNGSDGSPWWTTGWQFENNRYTGKRPGLEFPAVPYTASDFHCERSLNSWTDPNILSRGWLTGLTDLNTEKDYVRQRIADFITSMLSMGVSGIRVDAAKHIHPTDLAAIFKKLKDNLGGGELPEDFTAYLEVLFGGEKDLLMCGGGDYSFGKPFVNKMKAVGLSDSDILKIKIWGSDYPKEFPICGYWEIDPIRHAIGLDCHDDQFPGSSSRDMQDKGSVYVKERNAERHRYFLVQMFTRTDANWKIKLVLSSYSFIGNAYGYPDGKSDCSRCNPNTQCSQNCRRSVPYQKAYNPNSQGYDAGSSGNWKENTYTRTHRDREVVNAMRQWMGLSSLSSDQLYAKERLKARQMGL
jgi:alpha-amylase